MSTTTNANGERSAPDASYQRTDAEIAHQKRYEAREAARSQSTVQIYYEITEVPPEPGPIMRKKAWVLVRKVGENKETRSATFYNMHEVTGSLRENIVRDQRAAERLGVGIFHQTSVKKLT